MREPREDRRRYMLELVATYERAAYQLVPLPSPSSQIFATLNNDAGQRYLQMARGIINQLLTISVA